MFRRRIAALIAVLALPLSACASYDQLDAGLASLKGQNRSVAIDRLGFPTDQKEIAGKDVYIWSSGESTVSPGGYYGGCAGYGGGMLSMSCMGFPPTVYSDKCTIRVIADKSGRIVDTDRDGTAAACQKYAERLRAGVPISTPDRDKP